MRGLGYGKKEKNNTKISKKKFEKPVGEFGDWALLNRIKYHRRRRKARETRHRDCSHHPLLVLSNPFIFMSPTSTYHYLVA